MPWQKLKREFENRGITRCEICGSDYFLTPMHRLKRRFYQKDNLWNFSEVILACINCHNKYEYDRVATAEIFKKKRKT